jgi:putative oxidoreductase
MRDFGLFILRLTLGGLLMGHGAQKLFGKFGGHGIEGTGQHFESLGFEPGQQWAFLAGLGEFGGGALTSLGFLHPVGPITTLAPMVVAWGRVHWGKPIFIQSGGGELPATNIGMAVALALTGPGNLSLDHLFGVRAHPAMAALVSAGVAAGTFMALSQPRPEQRQAQPAQQQTRQSEPAAAT